MTNAHTTVAAPAYQPDADQLCDLCQVDPPQKDRRLCIRCAVDMATDYYEADRVKVGLCCSNDCGGYCAGGAL